MTALMVVVLGEEGAILSFRAPVEAVLPDFIQKDGLRPVRLDDLVHHTSGLADYAEVMSETLTSAEVLDFVNGAPLLATPGTRFEYSNSGYVVLGLAVAHAARAKDLSALLQARIFTPLGMDATAAPFPRQGLDPKRLAKGYGGENGNFAPSTMPSPVQGDGSVFSSINDLARYEAAFFDETLISREAAAQLFESGALDDGTPVHYGYGWFVEGEPGARVANHSGLWYGTATYYRRELDTGLSVIVLANGEDCDTPGIGDAIAALYAAP